MRVYNHDNNGIYTHESIAEEDPLEPGRTVLMLHQVESMPPKPKDGHAIRRNGDAWEYVEDHIGKVVYDAVTGEEITVKEYGSINNYATSKKPSRLHEWNVDKWVISKSNQDILEEEDRQMVELSLIEEVAILRKKCDHDILPLQDAVDLDDATPEEEALLKKLKRFRIALNRWSYPSPIPEL